MERKSFYVLSCGFTFSTLNYKFFSTTVESALQIHPFLTNKANFEKSQMNVKDLFTKDYDIMDTWSSEKNKANSKPIQTQYKANSKPIQIQTKPISGVPILQSVAKWGPSDYPCICELDLYNLVFRDSNLTNFYGDFTKWQMHRKPMQ